MRIAIAFCLLLSPSVLAAQDESDTSPETSTAPAPADAEDETPAPEEKPEPKAKPKAEPEAKPKGESEPAANEPPATEEEAEEPEAMPEAVATPEAEAVPDAAAIPDDEPMTLCPRGLPCVENGDLAAWPRARLRMGYDLVYPDPDVLFVGHNDGFFLDQARVGLGATYAGRFYALVVLELASVLPGGKANNPVQPLTGAARDAYLLWQPSEFFQLSVGQQRVPFDIEGQVAAARLVFTGRSVASAGVRAGRGYEVAGLSPDRQLGVVIGSPRADLGSLALDYRLALTNGAPVNQLGNDNKLPALYGRFGVAFGDWVGGGLAASWNPRTEGEVPNLFTETHLGLAGDVQLNVFGIDVLTQGIFRRVQFDTAFDDAADPNAADHAVGVTTWAVLRDPFGLPMFGFAPGYRFSFLDPSFSDPDDQLIEHTFAVRYQPPTPLPITFLLDATLLFEPAELELDPALRDGARYLDNHRVTAMVQFDL